MADPLGLMPPQGGPGMEQGGPQMGGDPGTEGGGKTYKEVLTETIMQIPIDQLIKLVQSMSKEELAQKIQQMLVQSGKSQDVAMSLSITIMKVIYERIQNETGRPISEIMQKQGSSQAPQPPSVVGAKPPMMNTPQGGQNAQSL
jgi:hypothetical protein